MTAVARRQTAIAPMSQAAIDNASAIEQIARSCPQERIHTHHVLHAGMYSRTIRIPSGIVLTGAHIKIATVLTISGDVQVIIGKQESVRITGYAVIPASAGRKQVFVTHAETMVTMTFPTQALTIEQAEAEFTDEVNLLFSRHDPDLNTTTITGE